MTDDSTRPGPFEVLGLLAGADREAIERRAEGLAALLKLGLSPPEGDELALDEQDERTPEAVIEAARILRDPLRWLEETVLYPDGLATRSALESAADLLEGAAGKSAEPAALVRQLAHQYLSDEVGRHQETDQPERWISQRLTPPANPRLHLGTKPRDDESGPRGS